MQLYSGNAVTLFPVTSGVVTNVARPSGLSADDSGLALNANTGVLSGTLMQRNYVPDSLTTTFQYQQLLRVSGAAGVADLISSVNMAITSPDQADYPPLWQANVGDMFDMQPYVIGLTAPTFSLVNPNSLPTGLSFGATTGRIYGTPAVGTEGTYDINVTITYPPVYATALKVRFNTLTVNPPLTSQAAPSIKFPAFVDPLSLTVSIPVFLPVALSGSVSTFSLPDPLPPGLSFNPSDGSISGTPTAAFTQPSYTVTVTATGPGGTASDTLTMTVVYAPLTVYYPTPAKCDAGSPLIISPVVFGFPLSWSLASSSSLPPGLDFNATNGQITGIPTTPGIYSLSVITTGSGVPGPTTSTIFLTVYPKVAVYYPRTLSVYPNELLSITPVTTRTGSTYTISFLSGSFTEATFSTANGTLTTSSFLPPVYDFTASITATGPGGVSDAAVITGKNPVRPVALAYPMSPFKLDVNVTFTFVPITLGYPNTFSLLPPVQSDLRLILDPRSGQLTGKPSVDGPFTITIQATGVGGNVTYTCFGDVV